MTPVLHDAPVARGLPPLENGDRLNADEFLRRYEGRPEVKKAELINGVVFMPSPVRWTQHAKPDSLLQTWLGVYAAHTAGTETGANATLRLGPDDVAQPDALLRILTECGGKTSIDSTGYLQGGPELVIEIAASSASIDTHAKRDSYRRAAVPEYLLWRTDDGAVEWWRLAEGEYRGLRPDGDGVFRSQVFPGLWLDARALLLGDLGHVLASLQTGLKDVSHTAFCDALGARLKSTPAA